MFKVAENYETGSKNIPTDLLIVTGNTDNLHIKLIIDSNGTLKLTNNIELGELVITDKEVHPIDNIPKKYVKVIYKGSNYGIPLYQL
jgi:hypothetical protein